MLVVVLFWGDRLQSWQMKQVWRFWDAAARRYRYRG